MTDALETYVHRYLPPEGDDPRTLLLLHGTGGDENDLIQLGQMLAPDAGLLSPRGTVLENGAPRFFRRLAEGVFDIDDLHARTKDLVAFVVRGGRASTSSTRTSSSPSGSRTAPTSRAACSSANRTRCRRGDSLSADGAVRSGAAADR